MENIYLDVRPSTIPFDNLVAFESKILLFRIDSSTYKVTEQGETTVRYGSMGLGDFGHTMETLIIWQDHLVIDELRVVNLQDDVRGWDITYHSHQTLSK